MFLREIFYDGIHYGYEMIENSVTIDITGKPVNIPGFGIKITSINDKGEVTSDQYENISPYKEKVEWLIKKFSDFGLSPLHLCEVIDEIIEEYVCDFDTYSPANLNIAI